MDRNKIYIGVYNSNNQESLFYQKDCGTYCDIKTKQSILASQIQEDSLIPYNKIIKGDAYFRSSIIRLYDLDRMQEVSLNRVFIGNSCQIIQVKDRSFYRDHMSTLVESVWLKEDILLYSTDFRPLEYANFIDMENGDFYERKSWRELGDIYISTDSSQLRLATDVLGINSPTIQKGKLLEKYREYKRR